MGNRLTFSTVQPYNCWELGLFFGITGAIFAGLLIIAIIIACCKCYTKYKNTNNTTENSNKGNSDKGNSDKENTSCCEKIWESCCLPIWKRCSNCCCRQDAEVDNGFRKDVCDLPWKFLHGVLELVFPRLISIKHITDDEVYLFGGKELKVDKDDNENNKKKCISCCTYAYFITAIVLAITWFVLISIEGGIYRKTTTCNDINVQDKSFSCFAVTNKTGPDKRRIIGTMPIDCAIGKNPNISVFCYLFNLNPAAIGIAFSIVNLIIAAITAYFKIAIYCVSKIKYGKYGLASLQGVLFLGLIGFIIGSPLSYFHFNLEFYFFHGDAPLRWISYFLVILTGIALIPVPWYGFTNNEKFQDMVEVIVDPTHPST